MIFDDCTIYDNCEPAGVELPKTNIPDKVLKELGLTKKNSKIDVFTELCERAIIEKGIDKLKNNKVYYKR